MPHSKLMKLFPRGISVPTRTTPLLPFMYIAYAQNPQAAAPAVVIFGTYKYPIDKVLYDTKFWREKILVKLFTPKIGRYYFAECSKLPKHLK